MNLEITIRVPISGGDAEGVAIATSDLAGRTADVSVDGPVGGVTPLPADEATRGLDADGTANGAAPEPPSLAELGVPLARGADAPPGPPDLAALATPAAAPPAEDGPPSIDELLQSDGEAAPPALDVDGSLAVVAVEMVDDVPGPPPVEELEGRSAGTD